jgi:hypothetical protein
MSLTSFFERVKTLPSQFHFAELSAMLPCGPECGRQVSHQRFARSADNGPGVLTLVHIGWRTVTLSQLAVL